MKKLKLYIYLILSFILMSCSSKSSETNVVPKKETTNKITYTLKTKSLTKEEFDKWVVPSFDGYTNSNRFEYHVPSIESFDYPCLTEMEDKKLEDKINKTIKNTIFNEDFINNSMPMYYVAVTNTPYSVYEDAEIIQKNNYISIPILLGWQTENNSYKCYSITVDLTTSKRLFLKDIIKFNKNFMNKLLYSKNFYKNYVGTFVLKDDIDSYFNINEMDVNTVINNAFEKFEFGETDLYYILKDGIVLTILANDGVPEEIFIPYENLKDYIIVDLWDKNKSN